MICDRLTFAQNLFFLFLALPLPSTMVDRVAGQVAPIDDTAVETVRNALREEARFPWYDAENDDLARVEVQTPKPPPEAQEWQETVKKKTQGQRPKFNFSLSAWFARLLQYLAWTILALIFIVGIYFSIRTLLNAEMSLADGSLVLEDDRTDEERIENLPIEVARGNGDFLEVARQYYEAGNFADAIIYLFSYQLMQLDRNHWIRLAKGKTNRQYLREIRKRRKRPAAKDLQQLSKDTMVIFEDSFFGHHAIHRERFESCWNRLDEFHAWVVSGMAT